MTAIAGLVSASAVLIGGDSAGSNGWEVGTRSDAKVFIRGPFAFGVAGSFRAIDLIRYELQVEEPPKKRPMETREYLVRRLIPALRACLHDHGAILTVRGEEMTLGPFLLGYNGRLFRVDQDFQVGEAACGFDAVGCGAHFALGALHATRMGRDPRARVKAALAAAAEHSEGVRAPFVIVEQKKVLERRRKRR